MTCPWQNTGSYLISEVKSCWTGLIPGGQPSWYPCALCLGKSGWHCILHLCLPPLWSLSFSLSDLRVILQVTLFSSLSKIDSHTETSGLGAVLWDHALLFGTTLRHLSYAFGWSRLSCTLCNSALGAASKGDYRAPLLLLFLFFQEGTLTNSAILLVLYTVQIFLSLPTSTVTLAWFFVLLFTRPFKCKSF